jgi:hypothetical protein
MDYSKRGDRMMSGIVLVSAFGFLEAMRLWGDYQHHWHGLGRLTIVSDFFVLPFVILIYLLQIFRTQQAAKRSLSE